MPRCTLWVYWCAAGGLFALTRHEDILTVSRDPATFCGGQGIAMREAR
ncbi:hypothetical protein [Actinomadura rudentiformis]|nr:hypothetical protein [Actinomadura rudentiformis]